MLKGRFYSRRTGWEGGYPVKCYYSPILETSNNELENKSGKEIMNIKNIENSIKHFACIYQDWYFYYGEDKIIYQSSSD